MIENARDEIVTDSKIEIALYDLTGLLKELQSHVEKEVNHWQKDLKKSGWNPNDEYRKLNEIRSRVDGWIKAEAERVGDIIEVSMIKAVADYIMLVRGKVRSDEAEGIIIDVWEKELNRQKDRWAQYLEKEYKEYAQYVICLSGDDAKIKPPELGSIADDLTDSIMAILKSLRYAGIQALLTMGLGAALVTGASAVTGIIGGVLAGIMGTVGVAAIIVGAAPLIPVILDKIKERKEEHRKELEKKLKEWTKHLDFVSIIREILNKQNEELYGSYMSHFDAALTMPLRKYERCQEIQEELYQLKADIDEIFPTETKRKIA
jgi:hypothetical protein